MSLTKLKKDELKLVAEELKLTIPEGAKIADLKTIIENSEIYKTDKDLVKCAIDYVMEEVKSKRSEDEVELELERIKLAQLEKKLELANIVKDLPHNSLLSTESVLETSSNMNIETLLKSVKTLTIPVPSRVESYNLFFQSLEKAFKTKEVPEQFKCEILLNILGEKANNLMVHISEEELVNYSKLKDLVLKEFSPTPQECFNKFQKAQKISSESYVQFASRLSAQFEYYCQLRNVKDFKSVCELIVSDKIMSTLDRELMTHISVKQGETYFKPHELGRECDIYSSSKGKNKNETFPKPFSGNIKRFDSNKQYRANNLRGQKGVTNVFLSEIKGDKCVLCRNDESHALQFCPQFKTFSVNERVEFVKNNRLCFKCLSPECSVKICRSKNCFCTRPHNKLLHYPREMKNNNSSIEAPDQNKLQTAFNVSAESFVPRVDTTTTQIVATACFKNKCLLSTALILVKDKYSEWQTYRALLDSGSETCLISNECANKLQLKSERINTLISCLNDTSMIVNGCVKVAISNKNKSFERELDMLVVKKITDFIPNKTLNLNVDFSNFVELADDTFNIPGKIDLLLGANIFYELLKPERIKVKNSQLLLVNSVFGYVVTGNLESINESKVHCGLIRDEDLNKSLEKFWQLEDVEETITKSKENLICEEHYEGTHFRTKEGKYVVSMPLKEDPSCLGNSKDIALKRLRSLWNRLAKDETYLNLYREFLKEYEKLGHMKEVTNDIEPKVTYYATHHGIYRPEKATTKLRVVFNCSSLTDSGISLNDIQYNGGVIQEDLYTQMLRFRTYTYAFIADIKMMYRTILINPNQRNLQRIVWCENENESPKIYELSTVTYGTVSAPYLAQRTLKQLSFDEEDNFPMAASVLRNNFYMDDVLCGAASLEEAIVLKQQLIGILKSAGMELHKLSANHVRLSPDSERDYNFATLTETKTLGVSWKPVLDCFLIRVKVCLDSSYTKRAVLSTIAKLFDPVGLVAPVVAKAKIFLQRLWRIKIDWNDPLPAKEYREWDQFLASLENINNIEIPRRIFIEMPETVEIHGFADASERCYGAAVYCKSKNLNGETVISLITSKSRVAPIKSLTIPRLELCAAVLLSKLVKRVVAALRLEAAEIYLWSDSMIVLAWLQREPMDLKTFVQNRVATIQELFPNQLWRHVPTDQNPADLVSRGVDPDKLLQQKLWWNGPIFLSGDDYPNRTINCSEKRNEYDCELKKSISGTFEDYTSVLNIHVNDFINDLISLSNNYITILRVLSFIFRFVGNLKNKHRMSGPLTTKEYEQAETFLVKKVQEQEFSSEINSLKRQGSVMPSSKLKTLNPFLDDNGLLRVGGRLGNTEFNFNKKHQIILPKNHKLTLIIIEYFHKKYLHVGAVSLLNHIREKFWPLNGRSNCRKIVHKCITCFKTKPIVSTQIMGNLPKERLIPDYPFNCSGVDFCGPFFIKNKGQRKGSLYKVYICIFVCFVFKAVHIELVTDLTSEAFIATLKRFMARRGKCAKLVSDNAKNFVGANNEIKKLHEMVRKPDDKLAGYLAAEGIDWKFIPPRSPNFGGIWEAAIKSCKYHLKRVVRGINLTYEELLTVTVQIEGILNSRPLCPLSASDDDFEVLTPAHFLVNRSLNSIDEPNLTEYKESNLKKWQKITRVVQLMWKFWSRNYLSQLQQRNKWMFEKNNVKIGDLVLLIEDNVPTHKWPLGRIVKLFYGTDKKVRVVEVKTRGGNFKRSLSKICILPLNT